MGGLNQIEIENLNAMIAHIDTRPVTIAVERSNLAWVAYVKRGEEYIIGVDLSYAKATNEAIKFIKCVPEGPRIPHDDFHASDGAEDTISEMRKTRRNDET